jgi:periplasmic divalent cation tolerance protein
MEYFILYITVPNMDEGKKIARNLVETKLAACVNIVQNIFSIYTWKNKIEEENEHLLIVKSTENHVDSIIKRVKELHSYENPECVALKIEKGSKMYLDWISEVTV